MKSLIEVKLEIYEEIEASLEIQNVISITLEPYNE